MLSAGDASGDAHAADLVRELRTLRPALRMLGMGGGELEKAGVELVVDQRALAVGGLFELLPDLHRVARAWWRMGAALRAVRPDLLVLVDASGFNIPLARRARRLGISTLYFVSPQVWAWRRGRVRKLAGCVDRMAVLFPFEVEIYEAAGVPVEFVGHPLVERLAEPGPGREAFREALGLPPEARVVALLPGSRRGEIRHLLPLQLEVTRQLHERREDLQFVLPRAPSVAAASVEEALRAASLPASLSLRVIEGHAHDVLRAADVALVKPGTSTLESALLGCPMVVAARSTRLTAAVLRRLLRVDTLTMPNLVMGEPVVPELLQEDARPERIADALLALLEGPAREQQLARLAELRARLGGSGAARRAARLAAGMLPERLTA
jgi:lipid-A-disaccharide synthase